MIGLLATILVGGSRGWWVFGRTYDEMRDERDAWRAVALNAQGMTDKAVSMAEQTVGMTR